MSRQARKDEKAERKRVKKEAEERARATESPDLPPDAGPSPANRSDG